jgi:hypothetical protein
VGQRRQRSHRLPHPEPPLRHLRPARRRRTRRHRHRRPHPRPPPAAQLWSAHQRCRSASLLRSGRSNPESSAGSRQQAKNRSAPRGLRSSVRRRIRISSPASSRLRLRTAAPRHHRRLHRLLRRNPPRHQRRQTLPPRSALAATSGYPSATTAAARPSDPPANRSTVPAANASSPPKPLLPLAQPAISTSSSNSASG